MNNERRFNIETGFIKDAELVKPLKVGAAFLSDQESYYTIRLMMFPNQCYYMTKNQDGGHYTIFSKKIDTNVLPKFLNPVGRGLLDANLKSYLILNFVFPRSTLYMDLFGSRKESHDES